MHTPSHTHISQQTGGLLQKITSMHIHMQSHACNHTHMHTSEAKHTQSPSLTRIVTKHQVLPSTACRVTPSPNLTSDLDDNRLSSPSLLVGKHCILQKPADTQNGVCVFVLMYAHFNVCALSCLNICCCCCFWFVLYPAFLFNPHVPRFITSAL